MTYAHNSGKHEKDFIRACKRFIDRYEWDALASELVSVYSSAYNAEPAEAKKINAGMKACNLRILAAARQGGMIGSYRLHINGIDREAIEGSLSAPKSEVVVAPQIGKQQYTGNGSGVPKAQRRTGLLDKMMNGEE